MVERLLTIKKDELNNGNDEANRLSKGQSFNTDDDESLPAGDSDSSLLKVDDAKRSLLSIHSPSIDSANDPDGLSPDTPSSEKVKKKRRRPTEQTVVDEGRKSAIKPQPAWYSTIDFTKPLIAVVILVLIYFMWVERDVWIPRLLTSNSRIRQIALAKEQKLTEKDDSPEISSSDNSSSILSDQDEIADEKEDNDNKNKNNEQILMSNTEETSATTQTKSSSPQKLNIRIRRNKMSFSKDRGGKKNPRLQQKIIDGDEEDIVEDTVDDTVDDDTGIESSNEETTIQSNKGKEHISSSSVHSSKKLRHHHHHHHQSDISHDNNPKTLSSAKTSLTVSSHVDIIDQLQKLIKSHNRHQDLLTALAKETGLSKSKLKQFIHKRDYSIITLDTLVSFLEVYDSSLFIVSH